MKQLAFLLLVLILGSRAFAQPLQAYAGSDTVWCTSQQTSPKPVLGFTATGGAPPYVYAWSVDYPGQFIASLLDSPSRAQPRVKSAPAQGIDSLDFVVEVTDAVNAKAYDTVRVLYSRWIFLTFQCMRPQSGADTVLFSNSTYGGSNFGPFGDFRWTPAAFLSDTTIDEPRCWAPLSTQYTKYGTDRAGCRSSIGGCGTYLWNTGIAEFFKDRRHAIIAPLPVTFSSHLDISPDLVGAELSILSADGRLLHSQRLISPSTHLGSILRKPSGVYFYRIEKRGEAIKRGTLVVR